MVGRKCGSESELASPPSRSGIKGVDTSSEEKNREIKGRKTIDVAGRLLITFNRSPLYNQSAEVLTLLSSKCMSVLFKRRICKKDNLYILIFLFVPRLRFPTAWV